MVSYRLLSFIELTGNREEFKVTGIIISFTEPFTFAVPFILRSQIVRYNRIPHLLPLNLVPRFELENHPVGRLPGMICLIIILIGIFFKIDNGWHCLPDCIDGGIFNQFPAIFSINNMKDVLPVINNNRRLPFNF